MTYRNARAGHPVRNRISELAIGGRSFTPAQAAAIAASPGWYWVSRVDAREGDGFWLWAEDVVRLHMAAVFGCSLISGTYEDGFTYQGRADSPGPWRVEPRRREVFDHGYSWLREESDRG